MAKNIEFIQTFYIQYVLDLSPCIKMHVIGELRGIMVVDIKKLEEIIRDGKANSENVDEFRQWLNYDLSLKTVKSLIGHYPAAIKSETKQ